MKNKLPACKLLSRRKRLVCKLIILAPKEFSSVLISGITISLGANILTSELISSRNYLYFIPGILLIISALYCIKFTKCVSSFVDEYADPNPEDKEEFFNGAFDKCGEKIITNFQLFFVIFTTSFILLVFLYLHNNNLIPNTF